ncbi:hypothetical protein ACEQ8H_006850 [Pleosporales sp. CAS-2024a]
MSDAARGLPSEAAVLQTLRDAVVAIHRTAKPDDLTVKRIRARAETELGLPHGFFKHHATWKQKSHDAITDAVDKYCRHPTPDPTPQKPVAPATNAVKRKAAAPPKKPTKRSKTESEDDLPDDTSPPKTAPTPPPATKGHASESEMSELLDESPKKKARKKEPAEKRARPAAPKAAKPKPAADHADAAEVKRLQGWLVKCGIRKVWSKDAQLSQCATDKEKIAVLQGMLTDVGMHPKYSLEKAAKIKEKRELDKDLAAIQEADAHWGTAADNPGPRPRRAAAAAPKKHQKIDFSDDDEDHETEDAQSSSDDADDDDDDGDSEDDHDHAKGGSDGDGDSE